jgi:hypothetical protein
MTDTSTNEQRIRTDQRRPGDREDESIPIPPDEELPPPVEEPPLERRKPPIDEGPKGPKKIVLTTSFFECK